ncbi:hypothetical protein BHE16_08850 [Neomicrococcus aestuarii]|uniref:Peptidoglycan binding-like domain-containing protein n=1 Tax=Neomicrococcus aestuarii TaxID=556325 RepID=A0A1L2ZPJ9_9MICC|nr:hypothetical protein BHE16_08850 [Neomicrococcus aestuarii]
MRAPFVALLSGLITAVVVAVASLALLAAIGIHNFQATQQAEASTPAVNVRLESGAVEETVGVKVHSLRVATQTISGVSLGGGVVTGPPPPAGSALKDGDTLVSINENPVLIIQGATPTYRSLGRGMTGKDVEQLQDFLTRQEFELGDKKGFFGASTALALSKFYRARDLPLINENGEAVNFLSQTGLPLSRFVFAPSMPLEIAKDCGPAGQQVSDFTCELQSSATRTVISSNAEQDIQGKELLLTKTDGQQIVAKVGPPTSPELNTDNINEDGNTSVVQPTEERWFSVIDLPQGKNEFAESARVLVRSSPTDGLRIPATAVHEDPNGKTFLRSPLKAGEEEKDRSQHHVELLFCASNYCAVQGENLKAGMEFSVLE